MSKTMMNLIGETDARVWAREFVRLAKMHPNIPTDEGTMIGWFANAIQAGFDGHPVEQQRRREAVERALAEPVSEPEPDESGWAKDGQVCGEFNCRHADARCYRTEPEPENPVRGYWDPTTGQYENTFDTRRGTGPEQCGQLSGWTGDYEEPVPPRYRCTLPVGHDGVHNAEPVSEPEQMSWRLRALLDGVARIFSFGRPLRTDRTRLCSTCGQSMTAPPCCHSPETGKGFHTVAGGCFANDPADVPWGRIAQEGDG